MATHSGNSGKVKVGSTFVAEVSGFTLQETFVAVDDSELSDAWDTHIVGGGSKAWSGTLTCHYDETDASGQEALTVGASVTLGLYSMGSGTGAVYLSGTASITQLDLAIARNSTISRNFNFKGNGALAQSTVP